MPKLPPTSPVITRTAVSRDVEHLARDLVAQRVRILQAGVKACTGRAADHIIPQAATRFHRHCRYAVVY